MFLKDIYSLSETSPFTIKSYEELRFDLTLTPIPKSSGCIKGWVRPHVRTCIKAFDLHLNPIEHTYTDLYGSYNIYLPTGYYYLGAVAPGYRLTPLARVRVMPKCCQEVNFRLTRLDLSKRPFS